MEHCCVKKLNTPILDFIPVSDKLLYHGWLSTVWLSSQKCGFQCADGINAEKATCLERRTHSQGVRRVSFCSQNSPVTSEVAGHQAWTIATLNI